MTTRIRVAEDRNAQAIAEVYAPAVTDRATSFELTPPDAAEMKRRIVTVLAQYPWLVCESSETVVGYERVGIYHRVGYKMDKWHDVAWFDRPLAEHVLEPPEPVAFSTLAASRDVSAAIARAEGLLRQAS